MRSILRRGLQGHRQHSFNFGVTEPSRRTRSGLIQQPVDPATAKALPPFAHHLFRYAQARRHFRVAPAARTVENDLRSLGQCLGRLRSPGPALQRLALFAGHSQNWNWSSSSHRYLHGT